MSWWVGCAPDVPSIAGVDATIRDFHRSLPGYAPTQLSAEPDLASRCGVGQVWLKQETSRFGLPSFKVLGAAWAAHRVVAEHFGLPVGTSVGVLRRAAQGRPRLVAATEGNHGRAVAWTARQMGLPATIVVPQGVAGPRLAAIAGEGAEVVAVTGDYDAALVAAAALADDQTLVVSDAAFEGYDTVPGWVVDGYSTIFMEVDEQLPPEERLDAVAVQVGVGTLAAAVTDWAARRPEQPRVLTVEPHDAACLLRSLSTGHPTPTRGPFTTSMVGLRCANVSPLTWPVLRDRVSAAVSVSDLEAAAALQALQAVSVQTAPTGAAALAGLMRIADELPSVQHALGLSESSSVLVIVSEGSTDWP